MKPRVLFRTHYQVDEPAYMELLVKRCTSPVRSTYREVVAERLAAEIRARDKKFNTAAGAYAVDLARGLELLTEQHVWTDKGHLVDLVATVGEAEWERELELTLPETVLHFWLFLESDGAALIFLGRRLLDEGRLGNSDSIWNELAQEMFVTIFSDYLAITNNPSDRVRLRNEIDRLKGRGYEGRSGAHKGFVHLQTLSRLGLIKRGRAAASRIYECDRDADHSAGLPALLSAVPDVVALESLVKTRGWIRVAAQVFGRDPEARPSPGAESDEDIRRVFASYYRRVAATGVPLASLTTLISAVQIEFLCAEPPRVVRYDDALGAIERLQKNSPKDVRFHVDRRGQPTFVKLSETLCNALAHGA